jgi:hypothetical protein
VRDKYLQEIKMTRLKRSLEMVAVILAVQVMVACSLMAPKETRQWQPTTITDLKSVAGKWQGLLVRNPRNREDDWVTLAIGETGTYEFVSYRMIGVFAGKGKLVLTDGKLSAKSDKGGQMTLQLYADSGSSERMLRAEAKDGEGFHYWADLKRESQTLSPRGTSEP